MSAPGSRGKMYCWVDSGCGRQYREGLCMCCVWRAQSPVQKWTSGRGCVRWPAAVHQQCLQGIKPPGTGGHTAEAHSPQAMLAAYNARCSSSGDARRRSRACSERLLLGAYNVPTGASQLRVQAWRIIRGSLSGGHTLQRTSLLCPTSGVRGWAWIPLGACQSLLYRWCCLQPAIGCAGNLGPLHRGCPISGCVPPYTALPRCGGRHAASLLPRAARGCPDCLPASVSGHAHGSTEHMGLLVLVACVVGCNCEV